MVFALEEGWGYLLGFAGVGLGEGLGFAAPSPP